MKLKLPADRSKIEVKLEDETASKRRGHIRRIKAMIGEE